MEYIAEMMGFEEISAKQLAQAVGIRSCQAVEYLTQAEKFGDLESRRTNGGRVKVYKKRKREDAPLVDGVGPAR